MKKAIMIGILVIFELLLTENVYSDLILPFPLGEVWRVDQGNYDDPLGHTNLTHKLTNSMAYAWDFNISSGDDNGKPIYAPANCKVAKIALNQGGWGNVIILDYGDGTYGKFAHVQSNIPVVEGQTVIQGETVIAYVGSTGSDNSHIHYQTQNSDSVNGQSIRSTFSDVPGDGIPKEKNWYTTRGIGMYWEDGYRDNSTKYFLDAYSTHGSSSFFGAPWNNPVYNDGAYVHYWNSVWVQDFWNEEENRWSMLLLNEEKNNNFT